MMILLIIIFIAAFIAYRILNHETEKRDKKYFEYSIFKMQMDAELQLQRDLREQDWQDRRMLFEAECFERKRQYNAAKFRFNVEINTWIAFRFRYNSLTPEQKLSYIPKWIEYKINFGKKASKYDEVMSFECFVVNQLAFKQ